jgi:hypothetical protein
MQQQSLYVVDDLGRERFIWATSAAEARARAAATHTIASRSTAYGDKLVLGTTPSRTAERRVRHEAAER